MSDAQRQAHADSGEAMPNGTMPIRDDPQHSEQDLASAQKVWGKHPDPAAARDHIVDRAGKLDMVDKLHPALQQYAAKRKEQQAAAPAPAPVAKSYRYAVTKATEDRYTFGPLYPADSLDAHGEYTASSTLQHALWGFMDRTDRAIHLQHQQDIVAGRLVEAVSWPEPHTTTLRVPAAPGAVSKAATPVTFPAGTAYVGVVWEPWAWNLVKAGKLQGLSMGGSANRVQADLGPPHDVLKAYVTQSLLLKFRADQSRIPLGRKGGGRWFKVGGIGPDAGVDVSHAIGKPAPSETMFSQKAARIGARAKSMNAERNARVGDLVRTQIAQRRAKRPGPPSRTYSGVYVGKSYALTGEPPPFDLM
jgi:hypothetical protein